MTTTSVNINLEEQELKLLNEMTNLGFFRNKSEAMRSAIIKYAIDLGIFRKKSLWQRIEQHPRRKVTPEQLKIDLENLENRE